MTAQKSAYELLMSEMQTNPDVLALITVPDFQHNDGPPNPECEDCGQPLYDCRCADLCPWTSYDGAAPCREPKDDLNAEYCYEHELEAHNPFDQEYER